jgi:hypothetical protein
MASKESAPLITSDRAAESTLTITKFAKLKEKTPQKIRKKDETER